jgi:aminocarboxymuconate-semialdehyde decarboxylase
VGPARRTDVRSRLRGAAPLYADTALFGAAAATRCGLEFFGVDRVLFATDMPFDPEPGLYARETIRVIDGLSLTAEARDRIYRGNAERLLKLGAGAPAGAGTVG